VSRTRLVALAFASAYASACGPVPAAESPPPRPAPRVPEDAGPAPEYPAVQVHGARSRFSLAVLGIELVGTIDPKANQVARTLTVALRALADADPQIALGKGVDLIDARVTADCKNDELPCMQKIARTLHVKRLVYGIANALGDGEYYVNLVMLDEPTGRIVKWSGTSMSTDPGLVYIAKVAFDSLIVQAN